MKPATAVRALNEGASAYVSKPLNMDEVLATVQQVLEKQRLTLENRRLLKAVQHELAERERAEERVRRLLDQQTAANQLALRLGESRDLDEIYQTIYEHVRELMDADAFIVSLYDHERQLIQAGYVMTLGVVRDITRFPPIPPEDEGYGTQSQVIRTGRPLYVPDYYAAMKRIRTQFDIREDGTIVEGPPLLEERDTSTNSALYVPMKVEGDTIGVLQVQSNRLDAYTREDMDLLTGLASVAAISIENARLFAAERSRREQLDALYQLSNRLVATDELDEVLDTIVRHAVQTVRVTFCRIVILEQAAFICRAAHPIRVLDQDLGVDREEPPPAWPHYQQVLSDGEPLVQSRDDPALSAAERQALLLDVAQSLCLCPLRIGDEDIGVLILGESRSPAREPFDAGKLRLTTAIADQAASAIRRALLRRQTQQRLERLDALRTIDMAISASLDLNTTLNVALDQLMEQLSADAADILLLSSHTLMLEYAADRAVRPHVGRPTRLRPGECLAGRAALERHTVSISDLRFQTWNPDELTDEEWDIIRRHPVYAYEMLSSIPFLRPALDIPYCHHERWDGEGYPRGLKREQIPLPARIFAVVDAYDALRSDRPYRPAWPEEKVLAYVCDEAGKHFDLAVVETFVELLKMDEGVCEGRESA